MAEPTQSETASGSADGERLAEMLALFSKYQRRLYLYIRSLLPSPADADDVLQETNIVVWKKFDQFRPGTDFRAWVYQIAYYEIRRHIDRQRRSGIAFSDALLEQLSSHYERREDELEQRRELLSGCLNRLDESDRTLVQKVHGQQVPVATLAEQAGRQPTSIYRSLRRIRRILLECVQRRLRQPETA